MRKEVPEIGWGDFVVASTGDPAVLAHPLRLAQQFRAHRPQPATASRARSPSTRGLERERAPSLVNLLSEDHSRADARGKHRLLMEGYGYRWYRVGGLDYILNRSPT